MNTQWLLARRPVSGSPTDDDFRMVQTPIPEPGPNQMLTRTVYLSLDPYQWGRWHNGPEAVGNVCHGRTVSQVVHSELAGYDAGDFVFNTNGWQEYGLTGEGISVFNYMFPRKIDPAYTIIKNNIFVHLEILKTIKRVVREGRPLLNNSANPTISVASIAKRPIAAGTKIDQAIGGFDVRGSAVCIAEAAGHVPIGLLSNATVTRTVEAGETLMFDDVDLPESLALKAWMEIERGVLGTAH